MMLSVFMPVLEVLNESKIAWSSMQASFFYDKYFRIAAIKDLQN